MNMIPIPSENCPECRTPGGYCQMIIEPIATIREYSVKVDEMDYRYEFWGRKSPQKREASVVQKIICVKGKGI